MNFINKSMTLLVILGLLFCVSQGQDYPCATIFYIQDYTAATSAASNNDITLTSADLTLEGQTYRTWNGNWTAEATHTIDLTVSAYATTPANSVYVFGLRASKNVTFAIHSDNSGDTIIPYTTEHAELGYAALYTFKASISSVRITITAVEASTAQDPNEVGVTFGGFEPPNNLFKCQSTCSDTLEALTVDGTTYPGAFCGAAALSIPTLDFSAPPASNGVGRTGQHQLNMCTADPMADEVPAADWTMAETTTSQLSGWARVGDHYEATWASASVADTIEFTVTVPTDATNETINNQSYILGIYLPANVTFDTKSPDVSTILEVTDGIQEKIMYTQNKTNTTPAEYNTFVTFRSNVVKLAVDNSVTYVIEGTVRQAISSATVKAYLGNYQPPNLLFECQNPCNQTLSPMVPFGTRYIGAYCWEMMTLFSGTFLLLVFGLLF